MRRVGVGAVLAVATSAVGCTIGGSEYLFGALPTSTSASALGGVVQVTGKACKTSYQPSPNGHVVWTSETYGHVYRIEATPGATPEDVSYELDKLGTGTDGEINISPDGQWLVAVTSRFGCGDSSCLALISQDVCSAEVIIDHGTGQPINTDEWSAVGVLPDGDVVVVYPGNGGPHPIDLFAITKHDGAWGASKVLTADDPHPYNAYPSLSADSTKLVFDCGSNAYSGGTGTDLCEVHTDGTGFRVVHTASEGPPGQGSWPLHKGNYTPSGAIVFEGEWPDGTEVIWEYPPDGGPPTIVSQGYTDDNTPCVLPDGRIVSLWLERPGATLQGAHEIKVMNADGTGNAMLVIDQNTLDIGQGCGK
jgi:hypothetical protein